jgi:methyl-accepting chemotaxis protein
MSWAFWKSSADDTRKTTTVNALELDDMRGQLKAINRVLAVIEFELDGTILTANDNFLKTLGYTLEEIRGKHHSMFVEPSYRSSDDYRRFWEKLGRGEYDAGQYKRIAKGGKEIWIQSSYNPILDSHNKPFKVVKYATDITAQKIQAADFEGQIAAINKAQAVIEFALDGTILTANENFLNVLGYTLNEVKGKHHSMFVDPAYRDSSDYRAFWDKLGRGEFDANRYKRIGKGGREAWIQATYNPIKDADGKPYRVVKFALDVTQQVQQERQLVDLVEEVRKSVAEIQSGAEEISKGNNNLSQRTEQQAASLEETASSMEEMTSTVKQTADNASQADKLAAATQEQAENGGTVVNSAVQAMSAINAASRKISDIIGVIDEIAFQTNLLALNAAVEAARAGEQGRGFAVVASEVRNLAGRSATAAKEIKVLIQDSVGKVEEGSALVGQSGVTLAEIIAAVKKLSAIVTEIAAASREQATGIEQVNKAVMQMDEATQQNAALVEQAAAASQAIADQTQSLGDLVARQDGGEGARRASGAPPKPALSAAPIVEKRRVATRPWSKSGTRPADLARPAAKMVAPPPATAQSTSADADWKTF